MSRALIALLLAGCGAATLEPEHGTCPEELTDARAEQCVGHLAEQVMVVLHGVYEDEPLAEYVRGVGERIAATSDRPDIDYRFVVLDDAYAQAWAVPGGRIFITRGLLARLGSEAELAGVLAHEVGHHAAGHVDHLIDDLAAPEWDHLVELTRTLEHDRDQERQADQLAVIMLRRAGYDVRAAEAMLRATYRGTEEEEHAWAHRHPPLPVRLARVSRAIDGESGGALHAARYLRHIDGLVVGTDPREGELLDGRFESARGGFGFEFPIGWHDPAAGDLSRPGHVFTEWDADERNGLALVGLGPAGEAWPQAALRGGIDDAHTAVLGPFEAIEGAVPGGRTGRVNLDADLTLARVAMFNADDGHVYALFVFSRDDDAASLDALYGSIRESFRRNRTTSEPRRIRVRRVDERATLAALEGCATEEERELLATINEADANEALAPGSWVKCIAR